LKAKLIFNLPEDQNQFETAINGRKMYTVLWELDQWLRGNVKYPPELMSDDEIKAYEKCRETLHELMLNENISFE
jgi:hypothetical protein